MTTISSVKVNHLCDPMSLTPGKISFSWTSAFGKSQSAFEINIYHAGTAVFHSGKIISSQCRYDASFIAAGSMFYDFKINLFYGADN